MHEALEDRRKAHSAIIFWTFVETTSSLDEMNVGDSGGAALDT
jgi:hypothetical protein